MCSERFGKKALFRRRLRFPSLETRSQPSVSGFSSWESRGVLWERGLSESSVFLEALDYHAPQKHFLPEKLLPELFLLTTVTRFEISRIHVGKLLDTDCTVRVKIITGSLVILENFFPDSYRYRLEIWMNYHCRYRLGPRGRPFISIDSQLPSRKSFELIFSKLPLPLPS